MFLLRSASLRETGRALQRLERQLGEVDRVHAVNPSSEPSSSGLDV